MFELTNEEKAVRDRAQRFELAHPHDQSWARDFLIRERMKAEWVLWLAFTTDQQPLKNERTIATRHLDAALTDSIRAGLQRR